MNHFRKQASNIVKAFGHMQLRAIRLKMLAEQFNQVKHLLSDEQIKETIEQFRELGLENPEKFISDSPETTHMSAEEIKRELEMEYFKMQIELNSQQIDELKNRKREKQKDFYRGVKIALISATLGAILSGGLTIGLEVWKAKHQLPARQDTPLLPSTQLVHDTIYIEKSSVTLPDSSN